MNVNYIFFLYIFVSLFMLGVAFFIYIQGYFGFAAFYIFIATIWAAAAIMYTKNKRYCRVLSYSALASQFLGLAVFEFYSPLP